MCVVLSQHERLDCYINISTQQNQHQWQCLSTKSKQKGYNSNQKGSANQLYIRYVLFLHLHSPVNTVSFHVNKISLCSIISRLLFPSEKHKELIFHLLTLFCAYVSKQWYAVGVGLGAICMYNKTRFCLVLC